MNATESGTNSADVSASPFPFGTDQVESQVHTTPEQCLMSITTIARQAQGMRAGEVIAKLAEDAYIMRVDNRVTQVPPSGTSSKTTKSQVAVRTSVVTVLEGSYQPTPTIPGHRLVDLLMVATVPTVPTATVRSSLTVILAAEAVKAGAPTMGLAGEPGAEATAAVEATRTATPPVLHVAVLTPARRSKNFGARSPPRQATTTASRLLCTASQSTSPGEIQTSGDHQVRREAGSSAVAQMLRPLHRECWWQ
jgi:hypothetical protein